jgi:hypothetical protein
MKVVLSLLSRLKPGPRSVFPRLGQLSAIALPILTLSQSAIASGSTPTITCPTQVNATCASEVPSAATDASGFSSQGGTITANCSGFVTVSSSDSITLSNCPHQFTLIRTYTVLNECGLSANCDQTITVNDTTSPTLSSFPSLSPCPEDIVTTASSASGVQVIYLAPFATENCDPTSPTVTCTLPSGSIFPIGTNTVTCSAEDACGHQVSCSFTVTVVGEKTASTFVDAAYAGKPYGTPVNYPDDGNPGPHTVGFDAFATIQAGVNATTSGGTLTVAAGTYPELVKVTVPMTINGANAGVDPRTTCNGSAVRVTESIIDGNGTETAIEFGTNGITLDGFTIQGGSADDAHSGVDLHNQWENNKVLNNIITGNTIGVFANCSGPLPTIIQRNRFDSNNLTCSCASEGAGVYVDASVNLQILDNEFTGHSVNNPLLIGATGAGNNSGLVVNGNHFHSNPAGSAIYALGITNGMFSSNRISAPTFSGIRLGSANSGVAISHNEFISADVGVRLVDDGYGFPANTNIHINGNSFGTMGSFAVAREGANNDSDAVLDASGNWWGVATSTGVPTKLGTADGAIDYTPWLVSGTDVGSEPCDGFQGDFSTLVVSAASSQSGGAGRIGEGINLAASGGTVKIVAGAYAESVDATAKTVILAPSESPAQVTINGDLTLGASDTLTIELTGVSAGSGYQLIVNGIVTLGGATLSGSGSVTYADCASITIIDNNNSEPVNGTFSNGSTITIGGQDFKIVYAGGNGNEVALVKDTTIPEVHNCPTSDILLGCNPTPTCADAVALVTVSDNCDPDPRTNCVAGTIQTNGCERTQTFTVTAVDRANNSSSPCNITFKWVSDLTPPTITFCPTDIQLQCGGSTATNNTGVATATDDCPAPVLITFTDSAAPANCTGKPGIDRTWTATDACGNFTNCVQHITFTDSTPPVINGCPSAVINRPCNATRPTCTTATAVVTATDNCGGTPTIDCVAGPVVTNGCLRDQSFTLTAVDGCTNQSAPCTVSYRWTEDNTAPVYNPQPFATCGLTNILGCLAVADETSIPRCSAVIGATDNCSTPHVSCSLVQTTNGCVRTRVVTYRAFDNCGNTNICQQTFVWTIDTTAPVFTKCPTNINLGCDPTVIPDCDLSPSNVTATDNCGTPTITCSKVDATNGCVRTRTLIYTATDCRTNIQTCTQVITWREGVTNPVLANCPALTLNLGCNPTSIPTCTNYNVTATDACGNATVNCSQVDATNGCGRTRTLTYTATGACGLTSSCSQVISWTVDTQAPTLVGCPATTLSLGCNPTTIPTCNDYTVTATDNCGATVSCSSLDATNGCTRTRTLTYTAIDDCSNSISCSQVISWTEDTAAPVITCPTNRVTICAQTGTNFTGTATATDNCANITITFTDASVPGICPTNRIITRTWTATDGCTNSISCDQILWVVDNAAPTFSNCPAATLNIMCNPVTIPTCATYNVTASDDCDGTPTLSCASLDATNGCSRTRTITYTAVDGCNKTNTCTQVVSWTEDNTAPVYNPQPFATCGLTNILGCLAVADETSIPRCSAVIGATDNCGTPHVSCSLVQTTNGCVRTRVVTYRAFDNCGNTNICQQTFVWRIDTTAPVFTKCPTNINLGCNPSVIPDCDLSPSNVTATDNCGTPTITCSKVDATNGCVRTRTLIYTATDCRTNIQTCTQVITWKEDVVGPVLVGCPNATLSLGTNPAPASIPTCSTYNVTATDDCGATVTCSETTVTNGCERTRTLTYTASDTCNTNTCSQEITWFEDAAPSLTVVVQGSNIVISWPITCKTFTLQQTADPTNPNSWTTVGQPVVVVNNRNTVTIPITTNTFYRLKYP